MIPYFKYITSIATCHPYTHKQNMLLNFSFFFFFFFFFLLLLISTSQHHQHEDLSTLLQLKPTLVGPTSSALSDWDPLSPTHCFFTGITCDSFSNVVAINLSFIHLHGSLSPNISLLSHLTDLSLSSSSLAGQLPSSISSLFHLRVLNISNNNFSGYFPVLENLNLQVLDAYNNNFSGPLPFLSVFRLGTLKHLHLGGNFFTGAIPETYSKITSLEYLGLNGNALTGRIPSSLSKLTNLKEMYIGYYNVYDGGIPFEFGELSLLEKLDLGDCNLTGSIPNTLGKLKMLNSLFLQFNNLSGTIPDELGGLVSLKSLDLSINELSGKLPDAFAELKNLTLLNLFRNHLSGGIPEYVAELPNLEVLEVWENNFTMELPQKLGENGRLKKLDVTSNRLTGLIPPDLCAGGKLELLVLMDNAFFGPIPEKLGKCKSLQHVRLANNFLNGSIPSGLFDLPMVDMLEFTNNYFSGELPIRMSGDNLGILMLCNNMVSGQIPSAIGNLPVLQTLSLESNKFSGEIPPQIGNLKMLSKLNLSGNSLTGEIPVKFVKQCSSLVSIDFSRNDLYGDIPSDIANLRILSTLNLSRNKLSGEVPKDMQKMQSLTVLDLSYNNLSGTIPTQGQFLVFNETSFVGNPNLHVSTHESNKITKNRLRPSLPVTITVTLLLLLLILSYAFRRWKSRTSSSNSNIWKLTAFQHLNFTVEDVIECLKEDNVIGKGGAGTVYRGSMPGGQEVAIKRLVGRGGSREHDRGFTAEITTLGQIRHRHIVRLLGFVSNRDANLLLYEYMQNGSLGEMLHGSKGAHLSWEARCRIAAEAALGLCYLHHDCSPLIVHRDVKSNNILLDSNFEAHVADFGLAKFLQGKDASECMSSIAGSYGYIAPEYAYTLRVDEKSDVYSFGVVLLELVTGRRPVGHGFGEGVEIVRWVRHKTATYDDDSGYKKIDGDDTEEYCDPSAAALLAVVDPRLSPTPLHIIMNLYKVAMRCVQETGLARPTMREVVHMLLSESTNNSLSLLPYEAMS